MMKQFRSLALLVVVAALLVAILAPVAVAGSTGVKIKLKGPSAADNGAMIKLTATIRNSLKYGGGSRVAIIMQNEDGHMKRIRAKTVTWSLGGSMGTVTFWVKAKASAMGIAKYRAAWKNPGGTTRSNVLRVAID